METCKGIYAVRDLVSELIVSGLIMEMTDAPAIRSFHDALSQPGSALAAHPKDFVLLDLGEINTETGVIVGCTPITIATGASWLESQKGADL